MHNFKRLWTQQSAYCNNNQINLILMINRTCTFMPLFFFSPSQPILWTSSTPIPIFLSSLSFTISPSPSVSNATCPLVSTSHSQRHSGSRLRGVLFVIGSDDLNTPLWHRVNYSPRENYCTPVSLMNLSDNQTPEKNESITMVVPGDGFHVRSWSAGKNLGKPLKVTFTAKASLPVVRANIQTPMRDYQRKEGSIGFHVRLCLFVVGYCCVCCKPWRPWAANSTKRCSPVSYNACVISIGPAKKNSLLAFCGRHP